MAHKSPSSYSTRNGNGKEKPCEAGIYPERIPEYLSGVATDGTPARDNLVPRKTVSVFFITTAL
jgi:hypothetical protein